MTIKWGREFLRPLKSYKDPKLLGPSRARQALQASMENVSLPCSTVNQHMEGAFKWHPSL